MFKHGVLRKNMYYFSWHRVSFSISFQTTAYTVGKEIYWTMWRVFPGQ